MRLSDSPFLNQRRIESLARGMQVNLTWKETGASGSSAAFELEAMKQNYACSLTRRWQRAGVMQNVQQRVHISTNDGSRLDVRMAINDEQNMNEDPETQVF